jgi:3-oxoacyl-[acyl-carrier-protein] synthase-3
LQRLTANITALGKYLPERRLTNADLEKMVDTNDEWIRTRTGITERRICAENEATSDMGAKAFEDMRKRFDINPEDIDVIIVGTVTPDMFFPSSAALIQHKIGAKNAWAYDLNAACSGFLYALEAGRTHIESGRYKKVLVIGSDTMSSIVDYTDRNTCVLFGDAAAAVLLEPDESGTYGILDAKLLTDGSGGEYLLMPAGGSLKPSTVETIEAREHFIRQDGKSVFKYAVKGMADVSEEVVLRNGLTGDDIAMLIPHQANIRIIDGTAKRLKLDPSKVMINIQKYGNTTAATIPLALIEAWEDVKIKKDDYIVFATFGAGFTWGASLIRWGLNAQ